MGQREESQLLVTMADRCQAEPGTTDTVRAIPLPLAQPLVETPSQEHCTAQVYGSVGQKQHIDQQVVLSKASVSSGEGVIQILCTRCPCVRILKPICHPGAYFKRTYIDHTLGEPVLLEKILTSLPVMIMATQPSTDSAIMM